MGGHVAYLLEIETSNVLVLFNDLPEDGAVSHNIRELLLSRVCVLTVYFHREKTSCFICH